VGLLAIINNYLGHFQTTRGKTQPVFKNAASEVFQLEQYLKIFPPQSGYFMRELSGTMMFINLVEESYRLIYSDRNSQSMPDPPNVDEIVTFVEQVKAMRFSSPNVTNFNHALTAHINILGTEALTQMEFFNSESIEQTKNRFNNPESFDLFPYLVKYYFRFFLNQKDRLKLVSSPLTFKNSSQIKSPESEKYNTNTSDLLNQQIRYFEPLSRAKLVDLNQVFASAPKPSANKFKPEPNPLRNSHHITVTKPPVQEPVSTGNGRGSFSNQERRRSVEDATATINPKQIHFQIDRNQFNKIGDLSMTFNKIGGGIRYYNMPSETTSPNQRPHNSLPSPSYSSVNASHHNIHHQTTRSSMPVQYTTQTSLNTHDVLPKPFTIHHQASMPATIGEHPLHSSPPMHSSVGNPRGKYRGNDVSIVGRSLKEEDSSVLYNVLHIPRKQSDTNYRLFGRAGLDESRVSGRSYQNLEHDSIMGNINMNNTSISGKHVTKTEEVLGYKHKGDSIIMEGDLIPSQLKGEKSPLENQRGRSLRKRRFI